MESDAVRGANSNYPPDTAPGAADYMTIDEADLEAMKHRNGCDPATTKRNESMARKISKGSYSNPEEVHLKDHHPPGRASSEYIWKEGIGIISKSRIRKHASSNGKSGNR